MSSAFEIPPCLCTIGLFGMAVCTYISVAVFVRSIYELIGHAFAYVELSDDRKIFFSVTAPGYSEMLQYSLAS